MAKAKSKAIIMVADGTGGMTLVEDRRFEKDDWPMVFGFEVPREDADTWLQYLSAECGKRGWSCSGIAQTEAKENSGSLSINTGAPGQAQLGVIWERKRGGPIKVRARSAGTPKLPLDQATEFFRQINERSRQGATEQFRRGWQLFYEGLPWRGELWLDDKLRLGPPSQQDESSLIGARIILVNAVVNGIDQLHAASTFNLTLRELSVFLTVVMGTNVRVSPNGGRGWTWSADSTGQVVQCDIRNLGYWEQQWPTEVPTRGQIQQVPLKAVHRPDFSLRGIDGTRSEQHLPEDILELWQAFRGLPSDRRRQFLQVGSMWQLALSLSHEYETARFAWMVAACEVLKPPEPQFRDHNIYHVVEALLGKPTADLLQEQWFRPQEVRNAHLHRGEFRGSEFVQHAMMSSFQDPTFDQASRELCRIAQAAIIEWLKQGGAFTMLPLQRRKSWRRWVKDNAHLILPVLAGIGIGLGIILGWCLRRWAS
jgi:hypothetical protein